MESSCWGKFCLFQCNEYLNTTSCWINLFKKLSRLVCYIQTKVFLVICWFYFMIPSTIFPLSPKFYFDSLLVYDGLSLLFPVTVDKLFIRTVKDDEHVMKRIPRMLPYSCCHTVETTLFWRTLTYCT